MGNYCYLNEQKVSAIGQKLHFKNAQIFDNLWPVHN